MNLKHNLEKYAELIVKTGINLKKGDNLLIRASEYSLPLARLVSKKAYEQGAHDVRLDFSDDRMTLDRYLYGSEDCFRDFPEFLVDYSEQLFLHNYHTLSLSAPNPELLKEADPARVAAWQRVSIIANKRTQKYVMEGLVKWCIASVASPAWATAVFPDLPEAEAIEQLWQNIFMATRVDRADPIAAWEEHNAALKAHKNFLNRAKFTHVHYRGPGTDLSVGLVKNHIWDGGSALSPQGDRYFANIPTEEVFSMPDADRVDGRVQSTKPLSVRGQIVDDFYFVFKDGQVVDFGARVGQQILADLLAMDDGAKRLGEIALVAANSPISNTGLLFKTTLYDENASCHFALGMAYSECMEGAGGRTEEENRALGMNNSLIHVDFMVGSKDVTVSGIQEDGTEIVLLQDGEWQI